MKIHTNLDKFRVKNPIVSFGNFDGVHLGHKKIISRLISQSEKLNGESVLVSFWPHPRLVLNKNKTLHFLTTLEEKKALLSNQKVDHFVILPFTKEFSELSSCDFLKKYLVDKIKIKHLVIGFNQQFGKDREGSLKNIRTCAKQYNFEVEQLEAEAHNENAISSSNIRDALFEGNAFKASKLLGHNYFITGTVTGGKQIGRKIGFPTANIEVKEKFKLIPKDGVYAVIIEIDGYKHKGMLNIGIRPTMNETELIKTIEVHIFNFNLDIYNKTIKIFFNHRIRNEKKFNNIEALVQQLTKDKIKALKLLLK